HTRFSRDWSSDVCSSDLHQLKIIQRGVPLDQAEKVLIMIHGRGGNAEDITTISSYLQVDEFALLAPQATQNTWYPYSFIAPTERSEERRVGKESKSAKSR